MPTCAGYGRAAMGNPVPRVLPNTDCGRYSLRRGEPKDDRLHPPHQGLHAEFPRGGSHCLPRQRATEPHQPQVQWQVRSCPKLTLTVNPIGSSIQPIAPGNKPETDLVADSYSSSALTAVLRRFFGVLTLPPLNCAGSCGTVIFKILLTALLKRGKQPPPHLLVDDVMVF